MRIDRLEITNFNKFSTYTIDLHPQFTLLVGDNGTAKTTILDALAIASTVTGAALQIYAWNNINSASFDFTTRQID